MNTYPFIIKEHDRGGGNAASGLAEQPRRSPVATQMAREGEGRQRSQPLPCRSQPSSQARSAGDRDCARAVTAKHPRHL